MIQQVATKPLPNELFKEYVWTTIGGLAKYITYQFDLASIKTAVEKIHPEITNIENLDIANALFYILKQHCYRIKPNTFTLKREGGKVEVSFVIEVLPDLQTYHNRCNDL